MPKSDSKYSINFFQRRKVWHAFGNDLKRELLRLGDFVLATRSFL